MTTKPQMLRSSMVVGFFSLLGSLTGILVETAIAARLGLSEGSDVFYVAFTAPYIITNLLSATGQFSLVPFFAALEAKHSPEEQWRGFSYAVNAIILGLAAIAVLGAVSAPLLIRGIAPGFTGPQTELASQLCPWLFLMIIPAGVAEVLRSFLLSQHRFALPSTAGFFRNVVVIACTVFTFNRYGHYSIVLGYLAGYLLQLLILGSQVLISFPVRYSLTLAGSGEAFRNLRGAGASQLGAAGAWQGVVIVERIIASFLPAGTLTALNYGFKIMSTLSELLAGSVGTAALPALSKAVARGAKAEEQKTFRNTLEISLVLVSPAMVFCLMLTSNITRVIFERGNFTPEATQLMAMVFFCYSLSLVLFAFVRVFSFYLFARQEARLFFQLALVLYGLNVGFDLLYVGAFRIGAAGIPLGLLTSLVLTCGLAFRRNLADLRVTLDRALGIFTLKNLLGAALAALTVWGLRARMQWPTTGFSNLFYLCVICGVGSFVFVATLALTRAVSVAQLTSAFHRSENG